jgi:hypothetical protein
VDLGNAFQVILFLLPGFLLISAFLLFIPARQGTSETAVIASSIAGTAIIWLLASVILLISQGIATAAGWAIHQNWHPNLWSAFIPPALTFKSPTGAVLAFGLVLNLLAALSGALFAGIVLNERKGIRILEIRRGPGFVKRLRLDLNPRVWNWFFQGGALRAASVTSPEPPRTIYRVTLSDHSVLIGEVTEYSLDPNDDELDLVIRDYSAWNGSEWVPVAETEAALVRRDDILLIERLRQPIDTVPNPSPLLAPSKIARSPDPVISETIS